ncbi:hypothetical protein CPB83DRAFT_868074 [Crepidotus variabilis]|uniref:Uncharacterized protein n=1 Tax=Crepidotus variabilis TaxID=179855 RepID=A0A9P6EMV0_9AGAR|nr:hypothetical protein CPB83DRAFT_868074 [Crepidotus variabilis]
MFSSPYSPFFTSGLLSQPLAMPPRAVSSSPKAELAARRGSLPESSTASNDSSAFYVTLQPRRDIKEYLSFLSLDLAESQSMRSASLKRKASSIEQKRPFRFPRIAETPSTRASTPLRSRFSRDSLRTIPSPKPAPSITLPELPNTPAASAFSSPPAPVQPQSAPPRLPSLPVLPALDFPVPSTSSSAIVSPISSRTPTRPLPSKRFSNTSKITSSTVSTRARRFNRSEALAALEGHRCQTHTQCRSAPLPILVQKRPVHFQRHNNFMSLSDDEESDDDSDFGADDELEPMDLMNIFNPLLEPEDVVLPSPAAPSHSSSIRRIQSSQPSSRRQRSRTNWFPLKSFIDLHGDHPSASANDDESNWSWRSFIEVSNVS